MLSSIFGGGERQSTEGVPAPAPHPAVEVRPRHWRDLELDEINQRAAIADLNLIKERLTMFEKERQQTQTYPENIVIGQPLKKANSSFGTPEDLIDLETPVDTANSPKKVKPQVFSMTPRLPKQEASNAEWEIDTEGLTEKEINLRCLKILDKNLARQHLHQDPADKDPKKDTAEMSEHEVNLRLLKALEKNSLIAMGGPPGSSPPSSSSSSSSDSDSSDRKKKKMKKVKKEHLKVHQKTVKEKDLKLPALPEAPEFDMWKDKVYHKIVTAAQRGSAIHPWIMKVELP